MTNGENKKKNENLRRKKQRGLVFLFFGNHIEKCRSTKKVGR